MNRKQSRTNNCSIIVIAILILIAIAFLSNLIWPDMEDSPWYPNQYKTPSKIMAEKWPNPDFNDPNFLADFRHYMGYDFYNPDAP